MKPDWNFIWQKMRNCLINKYVVTCFVFAVLLTCCGEHSLINRIKMHVDYRQKEAQLREYNKMIDETQQQLQVLDDPEALEQLARERYLMHADGEDVYLIDE